MIRYLAIGLCAALVGCGDTAPTPFPVAHRPVAPIVSSRWSSEESRDRLNEADQVMTLSGVETGMTVADIGAGEGYYTVRLSKRVGEKGRVVAEDIVPEVRDQLAQRVLKDKLQNVSVNLGRPEHPLLPTGGFDRILMVHMYHEIASPYEFLWNLRPALRSGGRVIVVDADRATNEHGTPPLLLQCEFQVVGYKMVEFRKAAFAGGYMAAFEASGERPKPEAMKVCKL